MSTATPSDSPRIEPNPKWVRGELGDVTVVDSRRSQLVWEHRYYPAWFFATGDVAATIGPAIDDGRRRGERPGVVHHDLRVGDTVLAGAARSYPGITDLDGLVGIDFGALDRWREEDEEVIVHPRSPYVRIDALPSSRHVVIRIDGTVLADSHRPTLLFETGLPPRYYLPPEDVSFEYLEPTDTRTSCPYKGHARFWSTRVDGTTHDDVAWAYEAPLPESAAITGLVCFYNERVEIEVDGSVEERPVTKFG